MAECGTHQSYWAGCRCNECRAANSAYAKQKRAERQAQITGIEKWHGTVGGYTNYKCRCAPCATALRECEGAWRDRNRDHVNAYAREKYAKNPERSQALTRRWQALNAEAYAEGQRRWRQANPDKIRAKNARRRALLMAVAAVPFTVEQLAQKWAYYGGCCYLCGDQAVATDHVKPLAKGGPHMLANLKPICTPCNSSKQDKWPYMHEAA